ncbi:MAG TPA: serine/threonine-protein kinase, partial [Longimicrobiales bacterium]|nr:serine/threonine-protein kinase [Longimicrobiales bacterium]
MSGDRPRWDLIEALVDRALRTPAPERAAFLERELPGHDDPDLRREVSTLVAHATEAPAFLERIAEELLPPLVGEALCGLGKDAPGVAEDDVWAVPGTLIAGRYRVEDRTGGGGMGVVYRAVDTRLDRTVALKVLPGRVQADPEARRRFVQEARAASALDHPNIATVYDILETAEGRDCIAMAHYEGRTLKDLLDPGPLEVDRAVDLVLQVARGLEAAHRRGIVHCDVKPENVLVTPEGTAKVVDFGLARFLDADRAGGGPPRGTLPYMAPELLRGEAVTPRTDVWALGVTFHETLTGRRPFHGSDGADVARGILEGTPTAPST